MTRVIFAPRVAVLFLLIAFATLLHAQVTPSPASLTLSGQAGSTTPATAQLTITVSGAGANFQIVPSVIWLSATPQSGNSTTTVTVSANPSTLGPGTVTGSLVILNNGIQVATVPVTFNLSSVAVSPASVSFPYTIGGSIPPSTNISLTGGTGTFTATPSTTSGGNWLQVGIVTGTLPNGVINVGVNSSVLPSMAAGTYQGTVTITPSGTNAVPITIPVTLTVAAAPTLNVTATALNFNYQSAPGATNQTQQTIQLSSSSTPINFFVSTRVDANPAGANWLVVSTLGGVTPGPLTVSVAPGSLPPGTYSGHVVINGSGAANPTIDIPVTLLVSTQPLLTLPSSNLTFSYQVGTAAPAPQSIAPASTTGALPYTVAVTSSGGCPWLNLNPVSGTTPTPFSVAVNPTALGPGTYTCNVAVTGIGAGNPAQQATITLKVANDPLITTNTNQVTFAYQTGQSTPAGQTVQINSSTGATLNYTVTPANGGTWLQVSGASSGTTPGNLNVAVNPAAAGSGVNDAQLVIAATNPTTAAAAPNSPLTLPVRLYVSANALLVVNPTSMNFSAPIGSTPQPQQIQVSSTSGTEPLNIHLDFSTDNGSPWLAVSTINTITPSLITVTTFPTLLSPGTYTGKITITASNPNGNAVLDNTVVIPVTLQVTAGTLTVSPVSLNNLTAVQGGVKVTQTINVTSANSGPVLNFTAAASSGAVNWLSVTPTSGATPGSLTVTADPAGLTPGTYQGNVTVTSIGAAGSPAVIPVTLTVTAGSITVTPTATMNFSQAVGGAAPQVQTLSVTGTPGVAFTAGATTTSGGNWLTVTPASGTLGTSATSVSVSVAAGNLTPGTYQGTVTITAPGATGSPVTVPVTFTVSAGQTITVSQSTVTFSYILGAAAPAAQTVQVTSSPGAIPFTAAAQATTGTGWLSVTPTTGTTPATLSIAVDPSKLAVGSYTGTVTVSAAAAGNSPQTITVNLTVSNVPVVITTLTNAASNIPGAVSAGEIATIWGTNIGPTTPASGAISGGVLGTTAGEVRVLFDGVPAPVLFASAGQINCIVPYSVAGRASTQIQVEYKGQLSASITQSVVAAAPGIFTLNQSGTGPGAVLNQDYSVNLASNPAKKLSVLQVYATGEGQTAPAGQNGRVMPSDPNQLAHPIQQVTATVGGVPARVLYQGSAPGMVAGALQVNVEIPANAPSGTDVAIVLNIGGTLSQQGVTVAVQ